MTYLALTSALFLGILTSISPCPLATNIAAISFIGHRIGRKDHVIISGVLYTTGRVIAYVLLASLIVSGLLGSGEISRFMQKYMNEALGPLMILIGMILLGWIGGGLPIYYSGVEKLQAHARKGGLWWALPIGAIFALSFCPVSAGLYFGGLIPLSIKHTSYVALPLVYAMGTALPVILFALVIALGMNKLSKVYDKVSTFGTKARYATGVIFILIGIYYALTNIYGLSI
ncbi:MAG: aromatic aminobenezylarsenical efflux permease ArsG family transporter [Lentisphaerota bacterium]